jgi:hypothetical protein
MIKNLLIATIALFIYAVWKAKGLLLVLTLLFLGGCNAMETTCYYDAWGDHYCTKTYYFDSTPQPSTVYVVEEKEPETQKYIIENVVDYNDSHNMSVYKYDPYCQGSPMDFSNYHYVPWYCYHYPSGTMDCDWHTEYGCYDVWRWDDWQCEWHYQFSWCE